MDNSTSESKIVFTSLEFGSPHLVAPQVHLVGVANALARALPLHLEDMVEYGTKVFDKREIRV